MRVWGVWEVWEVWGVLTRAPMKLDKIGQPWQNEHKIDNKTWFIDNKNARFACLKRKISNPNPSTREGCPILSNFSLGVDFTHYSKTIMFTTGNFPHPLPTLPTLSKSVDIAELLVSSHDKIFERSEINPSKECSSSATARRLARL